MGAKGDRNFCDDRYGRVASPSLDATKVGYVDVGVVGELLLGQPAFDPQPPHVRADDLVPVHRAAWNPVGAKPLGTIVPVFD